MTKRAGRWYQSATGERSGTIKCSYPENSKRSNVGYVDKRYFAVSEPLFKLCVSRLRGLFISREQDAGC